MYSTMTWLLICEAHRGSRGHAALPMAWRMSNIKLPALSYSRSPGSAPDYIGVSCKGMHWGQLHWPVVDLVKHMCSLCLL